MGRQSDSDDDGAAPKIPHGLDPAWLSATIGAIYDCVLDPQGWYNTLGMIVDQFRFHSGVLAVLAFRNGVQEFKVHYHMDDAWVAVQGEYVEDGINLWGGLARVQSFPLDEPLVTSHIRPVSEWDNFRYWREILKPRGLNDAVIIPLAQQPDLGGYLGINRHGSEGPIRTEDIEGLRLIAPHLRRAVTIGNLFELKAVETLAFRSVLDNMSCAVMLVDDDLRLLYANPKGDALLAAGSLMQLTQGRMRIRGKIADDALRTAVRLAAEDEARLSQRGIGIPVTAVDGAAAVLHVMPLFRRELRPGLAQRAAAAIFVMPAGSAHEPVDAIAVLYDFTPAEAQIFASLCRGISLEKTAEALSIAKSTARTHLLRIFAKTGVNRQAELVVLATKLSLNF